MTQVMRFVLCISVLAQTGALLRGADESKEQKTDLPRGAIGVVGSPAKDGMQDVGDKGPLWRVAFSPDGKLLATMGYHKTVCLWDVAAGNMKGRIEPPKEEIHWSSVPFSPAGDVLAIPYDSKTIRFIDTATAVESKLVSRLHWEKVDPYELTWSPDHLLVAMRAHSDEVWSSLIHVWDVRKEKENYALKLPFSKPPFAATMVPNQFRQETAFSNDGAHLAGALGNGKIAIWHAANGKEVRTLSGHNVPAACIGFSPDHRFLISSAAGWDNHTQFVENTIRLWEVESGKQLSLIGNRTELFSAPVFSPDGRTIAFVRGENSVQINEVATGRELLRYSAAPTKVRMVAFSPDAKMLASAMSNGTAILWDTMPQHWEKPKSKLAAKQVDQLWEALAGEDAANAQSAIWTLSASPDEAIAFLKDRLSAIPKHSSDLGALIADLNEDDFARRDAASKELARLINQAEPLLRDALETTKSPEQAKRLKTLLKGRETWAIQDPELLQAVRAIWVLQRIGTPEAKALLEKLAAGAPTARQTQEAQALDYLKRSKER